LSEEVLSATDDLLDAIAEPHRPDSTAHKGRRIRARRKR